MSDTNKTVKTVKDTKELAVTAARAFLKSYKQSARKARLVADLIRNKDTKKAFIILQHTNKKASVVILKLLNSAISNATNNHGLDGDNLFVQSIMVNEGPSLKRMMPRAKGRGDRITRRTCQIEIIVAQKPSKTKKSGK